MQRGLTLVELLVCLALAGVLLGLAVPGMRNFVEQQRSVAAANAIIGSIQLARTSAIFHRVRTTFCPRDVNRCGKQEHWRFGGLIFADRNSNAQIDEDEVLYGALPPLRQGAELYWRSFRNRSFLSFLPTGLTPWQNGHFLYCPPDADEHFARQVILNAQGRARLARDGDGDGVAEGANGRPLQCP